MRVGDEVQIFPSAQRAVVAEVRVAGQLVDAAVAGQSAGLELDRQLDVSRGDWIATPGTVAPSNRFSATLAWLDTEPAVIGRKYTVRHGISVMPQFRKTEISDVELDALARYLSRNTPPP